MNPIPKFDSNLAPHYELAALGSRAIELAASLDLSAGKTFQEHRRRVREALANAGLAAEINHAVAALLDSEGKHS